MPRFPLVDAVEPLTFTYVLRNHIRTLYARYILRTLAPYVLLFFFQAEDGIRDQPRSRGLGDVYKRQDYKGI